MNNTQNTWLENAVKSWREKEPVPEFTVEEQTDWLVFGLSSPRGYLLFHGTIEPAIRAEHGDTMAMMANNAYTKIRQNPNKHFDATLPAVAWYWKEGVRLLDKHTSLLDAISNCFDCLYVAEAMEAFVARTMGAEVKQ